MPARPFPLSRDKAADRIDAAYEAINTSGRENVFIHLRPREEVRAEVDKAITAGGPLAGMLLAVKDNIDVAGLPTTAACPGFAYLPTADAQSVARLRAAGAVVIGKTNLDQFATGLVGTRSPYGAVGAADRPEHVSGGSSSGSAVAVALGMCDAALGTDTAGSGRIPAALNGIVGVKPTIGVVSTEGVVPACASYDCVTTFARDTALAATVTAVMSGGEGTREWPQDMVYDAEAPARIAVPAELPALDPGWEDAFAAAIAAAEQCGYEVVPVDFDDFLAAARLLYDGGLVAERYAAVGAFLDAAGPSDGVDPVVGEIISAAKGVSAAQLLNDRQRVAELRRRAWGAVDEVGATAVMVPTAPFHPTIAEVKADPVALNSRMGTYTNFCNLFDLCAVAVPTGTIDEGERGSAHFGITVLAPAFCDAAAMAIAHRISAAARATVTAVTPAASWPEQAGAPVARLAVFGAHRRGGPLAQELTERGARWDGELHSSADYRMVRLDTEPAKPGIVRVADGSGQELFGEAWCLSPAALGEFLADLPRPMSLGRMTLADGSEIIGFSCEAPAAAAGEDITAAGRWPL